MPGRELDISEDWFIAAGENPSTYQFQVSPLDGNGISASMIVETLGTFAMTVTPLFQGVPKAKFSLTVDPTTFPVGVFPYRILATFANGSVGPMGHGSVVRS